MTNSVYCRKISCLAPGRVDIVRVARSLRCAESPVRSYAPSPVHHHSLLEPTEPLCSNAPPEIPKKPPTLQHVTQSTSPHSPPSSAGSGRHAGRRHRRPIAAYTATAAASVRAADPDHPPIGRAVRHDGCGRPGAGQWGIHRARKTLTKGGCDTPFRFCIALLSYEQNCAAHPASRTE